MHFFSRNAIFNDIDDEKEYDVKDKKFTTAAKAKSSMAAFLQVK